MPNSLRTIIINGQQLGYLLRHSSLSKRVRLSISNAGVITVSAPKRTPIGFLERFIHDHGDWIIQNLQAVATRPKTIFTQKHGTREIALYKEQARALVHDRIVELNKTYGFRFGTIAIRNQKSRWGSCSKKGNLNFNYRIALLPPELADYIIVHELCHLKEFNHSRRFWDLVSVAVPDHKRLRMELHRLEMTKQP